jgi:hypothetical protein
VASGLLFYLIKTKRLQEKESGEFFSIFKPLLVSGAKETLAFLENSEEHEELQVYCMKMEPILENEDQEEFIREFEKGMVHFGVKKSDLERCLTSLKDFYLMIQEELMNSEKENQKIVLSGRSA